MTRFFYTVFFGFLSLGIACIVAAFFLNSVPFFQKINHQPIKIETTEVPVIPLEQKIEKAANNPLHIVRICQGPLNISPSSQETNESTEIPSDQPIEVQANDQKILKRTYIFLASDQGFPEIITAKILRSQADAPEVSTVSIADANQPMLAEHGHRAEHGTFNQLRDLDFSRQQTRYDELWADAKVLCFKDESISDHERDEKLDDLRMQTTAYIQLDLDLDDNDSKIQIYYQVNGFIHQQEARLSDRPI